ncbi:MAG: hypothetical protein ABSD20_06205 [Terriglobales bacterium]|jgi:hypothetical protein
MNLLKLCIAVAIGFLLGAFLGRPAPIKAQEIAVQPGSVKVTQVNPGSSITVTGQVVGFSCNQTGCFLAAFK